MLKKYLPHLLLGITLCSYTDSISTQIEDRFLAGQLLFVTRKNSLSDYEKYWDNNDQYIAKKYVKECSWGFFIQVEKENKTPLGGLVIKF